MATSIYPLNKVQMGIESTKGTLVAATDVIRCDGEWVEEQGFYRSQYPQGVRSNAGGLGVITSKGVRINIATELNPSEVLWPLHTGVLGGISPSGGGNAKTWVATPALTTGIPTIAAATVECIRADGSTNHFAREAGYAMTSAFGFEWAFNEEARMNWQMFGRASQTSTPTGALTEYATRDVLVSNLLFVYLDTAWSSLGSTQLTGVIRNVRFECKTGYEPDYTLDGRSDLDLVQHKVGLITARLTLLLELDAVGAARFTEYRANTPGLFIRLKNTGSAISGGGNHTFQIDGAYRFTGPPAMQRDGEQMLVACELESYYDATGTKTLEFTAINELAAI